MTVAVGWTAPDFCLRSIEGRPVALADYRGRRVILWLSRGIYCPLCRTSLARLRWHYPAFHAANTELLEVGPGLPTNAARAFRQYLGGRDLEFPYLCDPGFSVHGQYGLRELGPGEALKSLPSMALSQIMARPFVAPHPSETLQLAAHAMEQGLFVIDEGGTIRYTYVTTPSGRLPTPAALLEVLG